MASVAPEHVQQAINQTGARWMAGRTSVSDLSEEQKRMRLGVIDRQAAVAQARQAAADAGEPAAAWPSSFDWRTRKRGHAN